MGELISDMLDNGYRPENPIVLYEGKILDGRNRYAAAKKAGVDPVFIEYNGIDAWKYVVSQNLHRRHLDETQRAGVVSKRANMTKADAGRLGGTSKKATANLQLLTIKEVAEEMNVSPRTVATYRAVAAAMPELVEKMDSGEMTAHEAHKKVKEQRRNEERREMADRASGVLLSDRWNVIHGDMTTVKLDRQYDFIITDPPYPKEFLPLWYELGRRSVQWLKEGGLLIAMCGQSYLDQIYSMMTEHLTYYWTAAYLTPGQPTPLRQVNVNSTWKPLLIFSKGKYTGKIFGDVFVSDGNDKSLHKWGQSESGMYDIISKIVLEGQSILDPFCGAGTTLVAGLKHNCFVTGIELEEANVNISKGRLAEL